MHIGHISHFSFNLWPGGLWGPTLGQLVWRDNSPEIGNQLHCNERSLRDKLWENKSVNFPKPVNSEKYEYHVEMKIFQI